MDKSEIAAKSEVGIGIHYEGSDVNGPFDEVRGITVYHDKDGNPIQPPQSVIDEWEADQAAKQEKTDVQGRSEGTGCTT